MQEAELDTKLTSS